MNTPFFDHPFANLAQRLKSANAVERADCVDSAKYDSTAPSTEQSSVSSPVVPRKSQKRTCAHIEEEDNALFLRSVGAMRQTTRAHLISSTTSPRISSSPPSSPPSSPLSSPPSSLRTGTFLLADHIPALQEARMTRKHKRSQRIPVRSTNVPQEETSASLAIRSSTKSNAKSNAKSNSKSVNRCVSDIQADTSREPQDSLKDSLNDSFKDAFLGDTQDQDLQSFLHAIKGVVPLSGGGRDIAPEVSGASPQQQAEDDFRRMLEGKLEFALALKGEYLEGYVMGLDPLIMENLRAGNYSPEAHIDLHGLNALQAYRALVDFFRRSWYKGLRVVLVVPGRGKNSVNGFAVLRDKLQSWLTQDPFKRVVLAFCTAQAVDGGPGSVYVLLRKYKKKGKICWERMPADADLF